MNGLVKSGPQTLNTDAIASVRPCNTLEGQRTAIRLVNGDEIASTEIFSSVNALVATE